MARMHNPKENGNVGKKLPRCTIMIVYRGAAAGVRRGRELGAVVMKCGVQ